MSNHFPCYINSNKNNTKSKDIIDKQLKTTSFFLKENTSLKNSIRIKHK